MLTITIAAAAVGLITLQKKNTQLENQLSRFGDTKNSGGIPKGPITISCSRTGFRHRDGLPWYLSVNSAGEGAVILQHQESYHQFKLSQTQLNSFYDLLEKEQFFSLKSSYGVSAIDFPTTLLVVTVGDQSATVTLKDLTMLVDTNQLKEAARAVAVLRHIRSWFNLENAANFSKYDISVLNAAKGE